MKDNNPLEIHAVRNADGTYRLTVKSEVMQRMGEDGERPAGTLESVCPRCSLQVKVIALSSHGKENGDG